MAIISLQSAATGLSALNTNLDVIANNLANVNTTGFKGSRVNFQDLLYQEKAQPGTENANSDQRPTGLYVGLGVQVSGTQVSFEQGSLISTGRPTDIAIDGMGFLQVAVEPDRAANGIAYTRAGALTVNSDGELVLANDQGRRLEPVITIPENAESITFQTTGEVFVQLTGEPEPQQVGTIELATFINPTGLEQIGENLFGESDASGPPIVGAPGEDGRGLIRQNFLEGSNVDPTHELIEMIRTQRAFEMNSQTIRTADEMLRTVSQLAR
jgi:flagellar basal-body rod protein FlgG